MLGRVRKGIESIRSSLWFWPVVLSVVAMTLAQGTILLDQSGWLEASPQLAKLFERFGTIWLFGSGIDGARSLLATIATAMITIAATVFSITIVALSLAAGQMGPRLLRTFMRDRGTQAALGMFIATFAFCIVVLGVVDASGSKPFIPRASVTTALLLALASLAVLIFFIHHVAVSIQAPEVIAVVGKELRQAMEQLYPETLGSGERAVSTAVEPELPEDFMQSASPICAPESGYLQIIDGEALMDLAQEADVVLWVARVPGDYVIAGTELVRVWPAENNTPALGKRVRGAFTFGALRTPMQDIHFLFNQLVEIAQRALSPGINDPITAQACVDQLGAALGMLAQRRMPSPLRVGADGNLRVVAKSADFRSIVDAAFDPIRNYSASCLQVSLGLGSVIAELAQLTRTAEQRGALVEQARMIQRGAAQLPEERDRKAVETQCQRAIQALMGATAKEHLDATAARVAAPMS